MRMSRLAAHLLSICALLSSVGTVCAQNFPSKPVRMVTAEPGGGTDVIARVIAQELSAALGQQVVVENRGGASGIIAAQTVSKAPPDGYTLLLYSGNLWILPFLRDNVPYDPVKDFSPITVVASSPNILVVHPSLPVKSARELISLARARPGDLGYSSGGMGTTLHLSAELFKAMAGVNMLHVPYKSGGAALNGLLGGQVQVMFPVAAAGMPHVRSGKVRAIAVTSAQPSGLVPNLPTMAASGLPGYASELTVGFFAPAGTAATVITRLNHELVRILNNPDVKEKLFNLGVEAAGTTPEQLVATVKADMAKWGKLIKDAGIRAD